MFFNTKTTILRSQFFRTSATYARLSLKFLSALPYFNKFLASALLEKGWTLSLIHI